MTRRRKGREEGREESQKPPLDKRRELERLDDALGVWQRRKGQAEFQLLIEAINLSSPRQQLQDLAEANACIEALLLRRAVIAHLPEGY
jgi:hypothetical protein